MGLHRFFRNGGACCRQGLPFEAGGHHHHGPHASPFEDDDVLGGGQGGRGGGPLGLGRVFGHGDLKLLLLALIDEQPSHGYELIRRIEDKFNGVYAPSPGTVYPTLSLLEDMGYTSVETADGRKRYTITARGRAFLEENRLAVDAVKERVESAMKLRARMTAPPELRKSMKKLKMALLMHRGEWTAEETERVRAILARAADEISADPN